MMVAAAGGTGKTGQHVARELAEGGYEALNLDRTPPAKSLPGELIRIDLAGAGEDCDAFAQVRPGGALASNPDPGGFSRKGTFGGNVLITYNVMHAAGDFGVKRFIYASSEMATGWLTDEELPPTFPSGEGDRVDSPNVCTLSKHLGWSPRYSRRDTGN